MQDGSKGPEGQKVLRRKTMVWTRLEPTPEPAFAYGEQEQPVRWLGLIFLIKHPF